MKRSSLTRQLIGGVLLAELICAAVFSFVAVGHEMHGRRRAFDVMLRGRAQAGCLRSLEPSRARAWPIAGGAARTVDGPQRIE